MNKRKLNLDFFLDLWDYEKIQQRACKSYGDNIETLEEAEHRCSHYDSCGAVWDNDDDDKNLSLCYKETIFYAGRGRVYNKTGHTMSTFGLSYISSLYDNEITVYFNVYIS